MTPIPDAEPSPDFYQQTADVIARWQRGGLPYSDAVEQLTALGKEAARDHRANQGRVEQLMGYMQSLRGNLMDSIHHYERARALFTQVQNRRRIAIVDLNLGEVYRYKGDFNRARALYEKAYEAFKSLGDGEHEALALGNRGQMLLSMGQLDGARHDLEESCRLAEQLPPDTLTRSELLCEVHHALALLHLALGQPPVAWENAGQAYRLACDSGQPYDLGFGNRAVAEVLSIMGSSPDPVFAADPDVYYQAANEAFQQIKAEGEMARTMFVQARSLARRGRRMTAARKLQHAMMIFTRLGMVDDAAKAAEAQREIL